MPHPFLVPSPDAVDGKHLVGRDPRTISAGDFLEYLPDALIGMKAIRAKCVDCMCGNHAEVRKCVSVTCALWPLRMGTYPKGLRSARQNPEQDADCSEETASEEVAA